MENTQFKVGQKVRAYDFKPMPSELKDRYPDRFVEGEIVEIMTDEDCYRVKVDVDSVFTKNPRPEVFVPFEAFIEFDGRIVRLA